MLKLGNNSAEISINRIVITININGLNCLKIKRFWNGEKKYNPMMRILETKIAPNKKEIFTAGK